jgi:hypothetical protein
MAYILILVIDDQQYVPDILEAWESLGVPGVTMIDTTGSKSEFDDTRDDLPFVVSLRAVLERQEKRTRTFFSVIEHETLVDRAAAAVLQIIPDFDEGHRGIMVSVPLARVWGYIEPPRTE